MISQFLTAAATIGLLGAGIAGSAETRSFQAMTPLTSLAAAGEGSGANMCRIDVVRTGAAGSSDITRQALGDGSCVCTIVTGPAGANGNAEASVDALRRSGSCEGSTAETQAAGAGAGVGTIMAVGFGLAAVSIAMAAKADSPGS